jgi:hypothetical protein
MPGLSVADLSQTDVMIDSGYEAWAMFGAFETFPWAPPPAGWHQLAAERQFGGGA